MWWKRGERPPGLCDKRFTFAYIFAAVEPGTDNAFALIMPYVNTEAMQEFLDRFAKTIRDDEHVAMVLDQAGWHGANALRVPDNIWNRLRADVGRLTSLCSYPWIPKVKR